MTGRRVALLIAGLGLVATGCTSSEPSGDPVAADGPTAGPGAAADAILTSIQDAFEEHVPDTDGRFVAAALVVRVEDGEVAAFGTSDGSDRDLARIQRPSGSTLKLIVDIAAAEAGVTADDGIIVGGGCSFPDGVVAEGDQLTPIMSIREATAVSSNCAFGKLARAVGPERLSRTLQHLGLGRQLDVGTRFGFGANTVSMEELATVGVALMRSAVASDETDLLRTTAGTVVEMTEDVLLSGTARGNELADRWAVAKTGTSARSTDAWIVGATPQYVTVVWMGNPDAPEDGMVDGAVPGYDSVHGGDIPASVWHDIMQAAHRGSAVDAAPPSWPSRDVVIVVDPTVDCLGLPEFVLAGAPGPDVPHIETGGPVRC